MGNSTISCSIPDCERLAYRKGYCRRHHYRLSTYGDPLAGGPLRHTQHAETCTIPGCTRPYVGKGLCGMHYQRRALHGDPLYEQPFAKHQPCLVRGCGRLQRTRGYCEKHYSRVLIHGNPLIKLIADAGRGSISAKGYRIVSRPGHPNADKHGKMPEHRYVMSEMIGRPLFENEVVHHKNGNRLDNRPENLELWVKAQPCGQRALDQLVWARDILRRYAALETNPFFVADRLTPSRECGENLERQQDLFKVSA